MRSTIRPASPYRLGRARQTVKLDEWLLRALADRTAPAALRFVLGDASVSAGDEPPVATIRFKSRRALLSMIVDPAGRFGDTYATRDLEVDGDLIGALETVYRASGGPRRPSLIRRLGTYVPHSLIDDHRNIHHHYDIGNDFYRLWLDEQLVYTCAYFETRAQSLEDAQIAKMDHVCRKLGLRTGETVIEAGCGWGALALHMARRFGVRVRAYNISGEQIAWARRRAAAEGLDGSVEFRQEDYRQIDGRCDAFVSVGMLEHVGRGNYGAFGSVIARTLDPVHGRGLLHFIGRDAPQPLDPWIRRRIFPGAYAPTLDEAVAGVLGPSSMSVLDAENLRLHYALTLDHWRRRYEAALSENRVGFDDRFRRTWHLYLAGSQASFTTGWLQLFQVVFAPAGSNAIPWTRDGLYRSPQGVSWNERTS